MASYAPLRVRVWGGRRVLKTQVNGGSKDFPFGADRPVQSKTTEHQTMLTEPLPIEFWVALKFTDGKVTRVMENWKIEPERVQQIVVAMFKEMGVLLANPCLERYLFDQMILMMQNSPEIQGLLRKAEQAELRKKESRHHDG